MVNDADENGVGMGRACQSACKGQDPACPCLENAWLWNTANGPGDNCRLECSLGVQNVAKSFPVKDNKARKREFLLKAGEYLKRHVTLS